MAEYVKVMETNSESVANHFVKNGWDIIRTSKVVQMEGNEYLRYHLGFSTKSHISKLTAIIKEYEKHGFKKILFEKVAEEMGDKVDNYEVDGFFVSGEPLAKYMSEYENLVNNKEVTYSKIEKETDEKINW